MGGGQHRQGPQGFPLKRGRGQGDNELGQGWYGTNVMLFHYANMLTSRKQRAVLVYCLCY